MTEWFLSTKFRVEMETCLLWNGETSKANILYVQKRENGCFIFAGPVLESERCYALTTQRNLDGSKYPALRALVKKRGAEKSCFVCLTHRIIGNIILT